MMKTIGNSLAALLLSASASFAEDVTVTDKNDGTEWQSYTTSRACVRAAMKNVLEDFGTLQFLDDREDNIGGVAYNDPAGTMSEYIVSFQSLEEAGEGVLIESLTHHYNADLGVGPFFPEGHGYNSGRGGVISYKPQELNMGITISAQEDTRNILTPLVNGAFGANGYGVSDYDAEPALRELDQRLRNCALAM